MFCWPGQRRGPGVCAGAGGQVSGGVLHHQALQAQQPEAALGDLRTDSPAAEAQLLQDHPHAHHPRVWLLNPPSQSLAAELARAGGVYGHISY